MGKRILWLDCFRITAIFLMMLIHTSASQYFLVPVESFDWLVFHIYDSMAQVAVPCFVMLSGIFFLNPQKEIKTKDLFCKNIWRMVLAYIFWDALYVVFDFFVMDIGAGAAVKEIINGHYHLWYLFMISGLYLITPALRAITKDKKAAWYFVIVSTIVGVVIPTIRYHAVISKWTAGIISNSNLVFLTSYSLYFMLGYLLYEMEISEKLEKLIYVLGFLALMVTIWLSYYVAMREKTATAYYNSFSLFIYLQSVALFVLFKNRVSKINFSERAKKVIAVLSECSFGMYLIHEFFNMIFLKVGFTTTSFFSVFAVLIVNLTVFLCSFLCIYFLRKIPAVKKYFT